MIPAEENKESDITDSETDGKPETQKQPQEKVFENVPRTIESSSNRQCMADDDASNELSIDVGSLESSISKRHSSHSIGMDTSVFRFKNVSFTLGKGGKKKKVLESVSAAIGWGHVLALMGPSGAGKTTLMNALTLDAPYGVTKGSVTLNGVAMTDKIFRQHSYLVTQYDRHWPFLTARETLNYAAELYDVALAEDIPIIVDEVVSKLGLQACEKTRNGRLSGGQSRRLSLAIALLKQPTLLFLDEPTSGLDAAASEATMQEIVRVAKEESIIIMCTIHSPSTKVYNGFDKVMILSKGRQAFTGSVAEAPAYFEKIGYPLPPQTNPAEHFLDLVNADFASSDEVDQILDAWQERKPRIAASSDGKQGWDDNIEGDSGITDLHRATISREISILFRRCLTIMFRDPMLYTGRCIFYLVTNTLFSLVYLKARSFSQDQASNKVWITLWHIAVAANMCTVAVYALNLEFRTIRREAKNGMMNPLSYILAKSVLSIPAVFVFGLFALGIPSTLIMDFPGSSFGMMLLLWSAAMYHFESLAEALSVWFDNPIAGMLVFVSIWFLCVLFCGILVPLDDLFWPFELFYYALPISYYVRSQMYNLLKDTVFQPCDKEANPFSPICVTPPLGKNVLAALGGIYQSVENRDTMSRDLVIIFGLGVFWKAVYVAGVIYKTTRVSTIYKQDAVEAPRRKRRRPKIAKSRSAESSDGSVPSELSA